jgi:hypothetical protein
MGLYKEGEYPTQVHSEAAGKGGTVLSETQKKYKPKEPLKPLTPEQRADQVRAEQARSDLHELLDGEGFYKLKQG